jgi:hypothetical protein
MARPHAMMSVPATTHPQLAHTVGFAPAADAWHDLNRDSLDGTT